MNPWEQRFPQLIPQVLGNSFFRMVESQQQIATTHLVDNLEEQDLLESLLENTKPPYPEEGGSLHYLLRTPFRYPPLQYGSRFGRHTDPAIFYGSLQANTTMAETAYYRFVFLQGMATPPPSEKIISQHTLFSGQYRATKGLRLQYPPFAQFSEELSHPSDYHYTQLLGDHMRRQGMQAFEFVSCRHPGGINVGLFTPAVFVNRNPLTQQQILCETRADTVTFSGPPTQRFTREMVKAVTHKPHPEEIN